MFKPILGLCVILGASRLLLALMGQFQRRLHPAPETARKLMHAGMGSILLTCPLFFTRPWPVLLLGSVFIGLLLARRLVPALNRHVAHVIYAVDRPSLGEFYFPISACALFVLARGNPLQFCIPMMLLTYADAAAALVGMRYGRCTFVTPGGRKSAEGCTAFFVTALILCAVPLLVQPGALPPIALLVALNIALLTTFLEAASWHGLDNLTVPLAAWLMLRHLPRLTAPEFAIALAAAVAFLLVPALRDRPHLARTSSPSFALPRPPLRVEKWLS